MSSDIDKIIIVTSRYIKPNAHKRFGNYIKYIATREGVEKPIPKLKVSQELDREIFMNYLDSRPNSHGLFSETDKSLVLDRVAKEVANHKGAIWTHIVSLKREDAERMGYTDLKHWQDLVRRHISDIAAAQKIAPENIRWYAAFHNKEGKVTVNNKQAEIVRRIFKEYLDGRGVYEISAILNSECVERPPNAEEWYPQFVSNIIANERYIGDSLLQKKYMTDTLPFQKKINRGEKEQYYIINTHQPIIDKETFEAAQKLRKAKAKIYHRSPANKHYPLSRMIRCSCGSGFRRKQSGHGISWTCLKHDRKSEGECSLKPIREQLIYNAFVRMFNKLQAHYKAILVPMVRQLEMLSEREKSDNTQLAELRKEISEIKQQTYLLTMLNSQGTLDGAYFKERTQELDRKLLTAQKQLHANLDDKDGERLDELRKLIGIFERAEQIDEFDEIKFGQIVEKITVLSESVIRFDLIGGIGFTERIVR